MISLLMKKVEIHRISLYFYLLFLLFQASLVGNVPLSLVWSSLSGSMPWVSSLAKLELLFSLEGAVLGEEELPVVDVL